MPATRKPRTSSGPAAKGAQKTLSFGTGASKLSKPNTLPGSQKEKLSPTATPTPTSKPSSIEIKPSTQTCIANASQTTVELKTKEVLKAEKITDAQIRKYWREQEDKRKAPRVHQEDLSTEEKVLRLWDCSSLFGPSIGITRTKRWTRAHKLGLEPPIEVLAVLLKGEERGEKVERAHIDELMSSKGLVEV